ncbi:hypothetical protein N865_07135 [Intrasporangium oryzae NRRL B-24470]|uniref:DUF4386 domain-containing protein n=1 Tax=Intrasporangium oryzae NRRL B-24470 TaxID=1386089 RepID=W9GDY2_9MICO|nr:DUF4386 domain-containing protein [Intrasporangium oryzae]EWT02059.1 hypothetical protein N865_07135 [Intrasporangium oryzae NRRL B-24470]
MTNPRALARFAGLLYLVTWVTSVAAVPLYGGSAFDPTAALAGRTSVLVAALLEVVLAVAVVGTSLTLYPLLRSHGHGSAVGYVALRTLEASVILVGVVAILPAVARPASSAGSGLDPAVTAGLHLVHDWTFLVGPGLINPVNAVVLAALLLRRRLVPRFIPVLGIVGATLVALMNVTVMFGLATPQPLLAVPLFAWEVCLAAQLVLRGLRSPAQTTPARELMEVR